MDEQAPERVPEHSQDLGDRAVRSLPYVIVAGLLAWLAHNGAARVSDPDDWWHLRLGLDLWHQHSFAVPDWSPFGTLDWVPSEPLPEVVSAGVYHVAGLPGLAWLFGASIVAVMLGTYLVLRRHGSALAAAVALALTTLAASGSLTSRPQVISFVLLAVVVSAGLRTEEDLRARWWLVPMTYVWSLCHGFWFLGVGISGAMAFGIVVSRRISWGTRVRLLAVPALSMSVVALNPFGLGVIEAPFAVSSTSQYISEWQRTDLLLPGPISLEVMIVAVAAIWVVKRRGFTLARALVLLAAVFFLWYAVRLVAVGAVVAAPLLTTALQSILPAREGSGQVPGATRRETLGLVAWAAACLVALAVAVPHTSSEPGDVPLALDARLDALPDGSAVFNEYQLGGWISWRHPDLHQAIDGLIVPYDTDYVSAYYHALLAEPGWQDFMTRIDARVALIADPSPLSKAMISDGWQVGGRDEGYVLLYPPNAVPAQDPGR